MPRSFKNIIAFAGPHCSFGMNSSERTFFVVSSLQRHSIRAKLQNFDVYAIIASYCVIALDTFQEQLPATMNSCVSILRAYLQPLTSVDLV